MKKRLYYIELAAALIALDIALVLNYLGGKRADVGGELAPTSPDLLFRVLPLVDLSFLFVWGFGAFMAWAFVATAWRERDRAPYIVWSYALLVAVRSLFVNLTPMHLPFEAVSVAQDPGFHAVGRYLTFKHDLFFSSHTALPYLGFLVFRERWVRWSFLGISVVLAATVLLGRLHYSIDVAGAYFITYALYRAELFWLQRPYLRWRRRYLASA